MNPEYPVYVISKGRANARTTVKELEYLNVPYQIVIEPRDHEAYSKYIDQSKILVLPFQDLGQGSIPARNWVWEHSMKSGHKRHWILDDNIEHFYRLNRNKSVRVTSGTIFRIIEIFTDRYKNIGLSGMNYEGLCKKTDQVPAFVPNTRIYSCILIDNSLPFRWRGIYNEDTDLSLRVLKSGLCTVLFNAFLAGKVTTMRMKGGNTDTLYTDDGRKKMAESLVAQHPDVTRLTWKFNRWHHQVDYRPFKQNRLELKDGIVIPDRVNEYGMVLGSI